MRKFKVVKHWPCGPLVGETLKMIEGGTYLEQYPEARWSFPYVEIKDYIEEVKEPEGFWYLDIHGDVVSWDLIDISDERSGIPVWLRFYTKESAEKFAKALKDSHGHRFNLSMQEHSYSGEYGLFQTVVIHKALNDRVK